LLRCLQPVLVIAAVMAGGRELFASSFDRRAAADAARASFATECSDWLTVVSVFQQWEDACAVSREAGRRFVDKHCLSSSVLTNCKDTQKQLRQLLSSIGFVSSRPSADENANAAEAACVNAALVAGLGSISVSQIVDGGRLVHANDEVWLHPKSCNNGQTLPGNFLVSLEKVKTGRVFLRDSALITPLPLVLFGGSLAPMHLAKRLRVGPWIELRCAARTSAVCAELRRLIDTLLRRLIEKPIFASGGGQKTLDEDQQEILSILVHVLTHEFAS